MYQKFGVQVFGFTNENFWSFKSDILILTACDVYGLYMHENQEVHLVKWKLEKSISRNRMEKVQLSGSWVCLPSCSPVR